MPPPVPQAGHATAPSTSPVRLAPLAPERGESEDQRRELQALTDRVQQLEALVARDEDVLRKLMGLLIQKGLCTREEILERIK